MNWKGGITKNKTCIHCGKIFDADRSGAKYCCRKCAYESRRGKPLYINIMMLNRGAKKDPKKHKISKCCVCGELFEHEAKRDAKYCSYKCWSIRVEKRTYNCMYCGKENVTNNKDTKKYCNKECYHNHLSVLLKGDKSHFYINGNCENIQRDRYINRRKVRAWRNKILKRDKNTCTNCGSNENLQAHHIKSWAKFPELRYLESNGITLCHECHQLEHGRRFAAPYIRITQQTIKFD